MRLFRFWREWKARREAERNLRSHGRVTKVRCDICGAHIADLEKKSCVVVRHTMPLR